MNLLLLEPGELDGRRAELDGRRARHVAQVLGAAPGERVRVGVVRGGAGHATVEAAEPDRLVLIDVELGEPEPAPQVELIVAMPRPKVVGRVLQAAAQLGVARVDLVNAWKVDKSYFHAHVVDPAWIAEQVRLGCEQGATTWLPEVAVHPVLMPFLRDQVPARLPGRTALLCHPRGAMPIERAAVAGVAVVAIGPEGGWIDREVASFRDLGFTCVTLGPRILRTEVAITSALSQLALLARQRSPG